MRGREHPAHILIVNETPVEKDERCWLEARTLSIAGHAVSVVCPKESAQEKSFRTKEGVRIHGYAPPPRTSGFWSHAWELAYCWVHAAVLAFRIDRKHRFDVVHACNPPDTFFLLAAICKLAGKKSVFAQHDLVPELWYSRFNETGWRSRLVHRALLEMERLSYRFADAVIVPNESYKRIAVARGSISPSLVKVVRNGPDLGKVMLVEPDPALREGRDHLVCYLGIMNPQDGVDYLLRAAAHLINEDGRTDVQFVLVGSGDMDEQLEAMAQDLGIAPFVRFAGWVSDPHLLSRYLCTSDVCVAPDPKTPLNEVSSFMKIMDYMAAAKPVVAFDLAETRISAGEAAAYAVPDDVEDFAHRIAEVIADPERAGRMGRYGRRRIEEALSWSHQEPELLGVYRRLLPGDTAPVGHAPVARGRPGQPRAVVATDGPEGKGEFLDFWRIPYVEGTAEDAAVSLVTARSASDPPPNAVVLIPGEGARRFFSTPDGLTLFTRVHAMAAPPEGLEIVAPLLDGRGRAISYILHDPAARSFVLPFSLDDAFRGFLHERYANGRRFPSAWLLTLYYAVKPLVPRALLARSRRFMAKVQARSTFPRWPFDESLERLRRLVLQLLLRASSTGELPFIWFWPGNRETCLVLTHDVESGVTANPGIWRLISAEEAAGLRSSFNIVPFKYEVPMDVIEQLRGRGCEVGVHGYAHDGDLFRSPRRFAARASAVNEVARAWGATGFRSSSTFRDPDLITALDFDYDCSFFDTDPFEPQPGGCLSLFPYFLGNLVEIPMTLPQDITLFSVRGESDGSVWREKLAVIRDLNAMACLDVHPDEGYIGDADKLVHYERFLADAAGAGVWNPLPGELARWWRDRAAARIVFNGRGPEVSGGSPEMEIRWARLVEDRLVFEAADARPGSGRAG